MAVLAQLQDMGLTLTVEGDTLRAGPKAAMTEEARALIRAHKDDLLAALEHANLDTLLAAACRGVPGIDATTFKSLLSPEDVEDIEGGHIPMVTLNAYARSFVGRIKVSAAMHGAFKTP